MFLASLSAKSVRLDSWAGNLATSVFPASNGHAASPPGQPRPCRLSPLAPPLGTHRAQPPARRVPGGTSLLEWKRPRCAPPWGTSCVGACPRARLTPCARPVPAFTARAAPGAHRAQPPARRAPGGTSLAWCSSLLGPRGPLAASAVVGSPYPRPADHARCHDAAVVVVAALTRRHRGVSGRGAGPHAAPG